MALSHVEDSDIEGLHDDYDHLRGEFDRLSFPPDRGGSESWYMMQEVEMEDFDFDPQSPPQTDLSENELEEVMLNGGIFNWHQPNISSNILPLEDESLEEDEDDGEDEEEDDGEIDEELMEDEGNGEDNDESSLEGDSDGSPSSISPTALSPVYRDSPDSMGRSDCENQPIEPCDSPCISRPGSPWPMFARPSFKKTRNPFWTTFRVREFR